jgi:YbbR domain-containing protein
LTRAETINARIQLPEETNIWLERSQVEVKLDIQRLAQNRLSEVPITVINVPPGQSATPVPQNLTVVLKGGAKILAGLNRDNLRAYINYRTDYVASEDRYRVNFNIGDQIEIVAYEPRYFDILLRKIER